MYKTVIIKLIGITSIIILCMLLIFSLISCDNEKKYIANDDNGNEYEQGKVYDMPSVINMLSASNEDIILSAKVKPENASNAELTWQLTWVNAESEWARGKNVNDFLSLNINNKLNTALFSCKAPFGEKAIITVISKDNEKAKATCTVNFVAPIVDFHFNLYYRDEHSNKTLIATLNDYGHSGDFELNTLSGRLPKILPVQDQKTIYEFDVVPDYGLGTVLPEIPPISGNIGEVSANIPYETLEWAVDECGGSYSDVTLYVSSEPTVIFNQGFTVSLNTLYEPIKKTIKTGATSFTYQELINKLTNAGTRPALRVSVTGEITFNGLTKKNIFFHFGFTKDAFYKSVEGVEMSDSEIFL